LPFLINLISKIPSTSRQVFSLAVWVLSNLCRGTPRPPYESVKDALPVFATIIQETQNQEALTDALWGIFYFSENAEFKNDVLQTNILPTLIKYLEYPFIPKFSHIPSHAAPNVVLPAIKALTNYISAGNPDQFDVFLSFVFPFK